MQTAIKIIPKHLLYQRISVKLNRNNKTHLECGVSMSRSGIHPCRQARQCLHNLALHTNLVGFQNSTQFFQGHFNTCFWKTTNLLPNFHYTIQYKHEYYYSGINPVEFRGLFFSHFPNTTDPYSFFVTFLSCTTSTIPLYFQQFPIQSFLKFFKCLSSLSYFFLFSIMFTYFFIFTKDSSAHFSVLKCFGCRWQCSFVTFSFHNALFVSP